MHVVATLRAQKEKQLLADFTGKLEDQIAGGGTFATLPALIGVGLPANVANATSNFALLPGAATSAWTWRPHRWC